MKIYYACILFLVLVLQIVIQRRKKLLKNFKENCIFFLPIAVTYSIIVLALSFDIDINSMLGMIVSISIIISCYAWSAFYFSPIKGKGIQYAEVYIKDSDKTYDVRYRDVIYNGNYVFIKNRENNKVVDMIQINREDIIKIRYYSERLTSSKISL